MLAKLWSVAAVGAIVGLLTMPASAATAQGQSKPAAAKTHHKMSCGDYAWQSQEMKDCMAKQGATKKPATKKVSKKSPAAATPKKTS
jgi:hypothetical protein